MEDDLGIKVIAMHFPPVDILFGPDTIITAWGTVILYIKYQ